MQILFKADLVWLKLETSPQAVDMMKSLSGVVKLRSWCEKVADLYVGYPKKDCVDGRNSLAEASNLSFLAISGSFIFAWD
jgi:hypothetical protein